MFILASKSLTSSIVQLKTFNDHYDEYKKVYTVVLYKRSADNFDVKLDEKIPETVSFLRAI